MATRILYLNLVPAVQSRTMFLLTLSLTVLAGAGDTLHLAPGHDGGVPGLPVLVVLSLHGTPPAGQDVQTAPDPAHVVQLLTVHLQDRRGGLHLLVNLLWLLGTDLAAGQGVGPLGLLGEAGGEWRTLLLVAVHS